MQEGLAAPAQCFNSAGAYWNRANAKLSICRSLHHSIMMIPLLTLMCLEKHRKSATFSSLGTLALVLFFGLVGFVGSVP
jgi:hypothetical protein